MDDKPDDLTRGERDELATMLRWIVLLIEMASVYGNADVVMWLTLAEAEIRRHLAEEGCTSRH